MVRVREVRNPCFRNEFMLIILVSNLVVSFDGFNVVWTTY